MLQSEQELCTKAKATKVPFFKLWPWFLSTVKVDQ